MNLSKATANSDKSLTIYAPGTIPGCQRMINGTRIHRSSPAALAGSASNAEGLIVAVSKKDPFRNGRGQPIRCSAESSRPPWPSNLGHFFWHPKSVSKTRGMRHRGRNRSDSARDAPSRESFAAQPSLFDCSLQPLDVADDGITRFAAVFWSS